MWRVTVACKGGQTVSRGCHSVTKLDRELSANTSATQMDLAFVDFWVSFCFVFFPLGHLLWFNTLTEEDAYVGFNSKSYCFDCKNNAGVFVSSESGWPFWSPWSPRQVGVDNQRCEARRLGPLWLWGTQQDRRSSEEHVSGYWVWVCHNLISV